MSHSAISQQIRGFEATHGLRLFERIGGKHQPTPFCLELGEISERMKENEAELARLLARRNPAGQLHMRVGLGNSMPGLAIIGEALAHQPHLTISVESGSHQTIMKAVLRREVDVGILPDVPPDPRFRRIPVGEQQVVAIVADQLPLARRDTISIEELATEPLIFRSHGSSTQKIVDRAFARAGLSPLPRLTADSRDSVYEAVSLGLGVGFMWRLGTHRIGQVRRLSVHGLGQGATEVIFALSEDKNEMANRLFIAAQVYANRLK